MILRWNSTPSKAYGCLLSVVLWTVIREAIKRVYYFRQVDEDLMKAQQAAYSIAGVDESVSIMTAPSLGKHSGLLYR